jgi:exopolyphosphatase/pppGpp-phosphohydrolase
MLGSCRDPSNLSSRDKIKAYLNQGFKSYQLVVDIGSGHLKIAVFNEATKSVWKWKYKVNLASGANKSDGTPSAEKLDLLFERLCDLAIVLDAFGDNVRIVGTESFRNLTKTAEGRRYIARIRKYAFNNRTIRILTGEEEALYNIDAACLEFGLKRDKLTKAAFAAMGGGSLQYAEAFDGSLKETSVACGVNPLIQNTNDIAEQAGQWVKKALAEKALVTTSQTTSKISTYWEGIFAIFLN